MAQDTRGGVPNIFPEIIYDDAPAALDWLVRVFGFVKGEVIEGPQGPSRTPRCTWVRARSCQSRRWPRPNSG